MDLNPLAWLNVQHTFEQHLNNFINTVTAQLKVLVVTHNYPTQQTPSHAPFIGDQVEALRTLGVSIDLLHFSTDNKFNYLIPLKYILSLNFSPKQYDIVHGYYGTINGYLARLQWKSPVVVTYLGSDINHWRDGFIGRQLIPWIDGIIVMSPEMKAKIKRPDVFIIPFGINLEIFKPIPKAEARQKLNLPQDKKYILFPWNPQRALKRYDLCSAAYKILAKRFSNVEIITVHNVPHSEMSLYMNASDVLVCTSDHEGSPSSVREAMACNLPIVSVDVGDVRTLISGIKHCYICQRDAEDIAEKISWVLEKSERSNGRIFMQGKDSLTAAKQVIEVYRYVLDKKSDKK